MMEEIKETLIAFICTNFMVDREDINMDNSLVDDGFIDSFGLIEIASFIEKTFGFEVKDDDMTRDNFGSVNKMTEYIVKRKPA